MKVRFKRPKTKGHLEELEVRGLWKAIALTKQIAESKEKISIETILEIHKTIFENAFPEIAGRFRKNGEDVKKLKFIEPPPGRLVEEKFYSFWRNLDTTLSSISQHPKSQTKSQRKKWLGQVFDLATWAQHNISEIHPFCDGNGRMARLMTNLILRRFGLPESRVKYEGEDKERYLHALHQIDTVQDYEPLKKLIVLSVADTYERIKKIGQNKKQHSHH